MNVILFIIIYKKFIFFNQLVVSPNENEARPVHEPDALLPVQIHGEIDATHHRLPLRTVKQVFVEVLTNQEINKKTRANVPILDQVIYLSSFVMLYKFYF